jgi:hypothetical protein
LYVLPLALIAHTSFADLAIVLHHGFPIQYSNSPNAYH